MKDIQVIREDKYETLESYKETIRYMIIPQLWGPFQNLSIADSP
jgi:hypothetical protein